MLMNQSANLMYLKPFLWATLIEQLKHHSIANEEEKIPSLVIVFS